MHAIVGSIRPVEADGPCVQHSKATGLQKTPRYVVIDESVVVEICGSINMVCVGCGQAKNSVFHTRGVVGQYIFYALLIYFKSCVFGVIPES